MTLFRPLGLLGLLMVAALILIYILKPNYLQKRISSSYVWKLSLKYRRKRIPISKLRNLLLIICQILILCSCAFILAEPNRVLGEKIDQNELIAIIDSSASMRTETGNITRFERAINSAMHDFDGLAADGYFSVIIASPKPYFLLEKIKAGNKARLSEAMQELLDDEMSCSFGSANIEEAMSLCENLLRTNPAASIKLYTDTAYSYIPSNVEVINIWDRNEWNAAILNAYAEIDDNYYVFYVDVACYGRDTKIKLTMEVQDANASADSGVGKRVVFSTILNCSQDITRTVIFKYFQDGETPPDLGEGSNTEYYQINGNDRVYSYQSVVFSLNENDFFQEDNTFVIYGGQKEVLKIQYASTSPNSFVNGILFLFQNRYKDTWDIKVTEVKSKQQDPEMTGYDFYIFEHSMPASMPTDGAVLLINPDKAPADSGIHFVGVRDFSQDIYLSQGKQHPITANVIADEITVRRYVSLKEDASYQTLMSYGSDPLLLINTESSARIAVLSFSLHYSNLPILAAFPRLMNNMFAYFLPPTVVKNAFEVFENINIMARGPELNVVNFSDDKQTLTSFPAVWTTGIPGTYKLEQTTFSKKEVSEKIYVKIPAIESNIWRIEDVLEGPARLQDDTDYFQDLLVFIAAALVTVLFVEWWLHSREKA